MARSRASAFDDGLRVYGLKRWNARSRITTDWYNLHYDPELSFANGDCLVYLQEPNQSARGPAFRVHTSQLSAKGFQCLVDKCIFMPSSPSCAISSCTGCETSPGFRELYLPAPVGVSKYMTFEYHLTTRNFFAWLYNLPLTGRTLGNSLVNLLGRLHAFRPDDEEKNTDELVEYLELQGYSDFRECVDHALGALYLAEKFELGHLWIDAFSHCVGLYHSLQASVEFQAISTTTKAMINRHRLEMDVRLDRMNKSLTEFFEGDFSGADFGLSEAAREHFDCFRSFLHSYYIEQYGFWPPAEFHERFSVQSSTYKAMYSDFRNLYQYLVDPESSPSIQDNPLVSGGLCILQNIKAFDQRFRFESLPHPLPRVPTIPTYNLSLRRQSLNPIRRRRVESEVRNAAVTQAFIDSTNRDWNIPKGHLVRRYAAFEGQSILEGDKNVSFADGRKVRWILIYSILQFLVSVIRAPKDVRDTEGVSYPLCCQVPKAMPWQVDPILKRSKTAPAAPIESKEARIELKPDVDYLHTSTSSSSLLSATSRPIRKASTFGLNSRSFSATNTRSLSRATSFRNMLIRRSTSSTITPPTTPTRKRPALCEIFIPRYGNGLNEATKTTDDTSTDSDSSSPPSTMPVTPTTLVSRESSNASSGHSRSSTRPESDGHPDMDHNSVDGDAYNEMNDSGTLHVLDEENKMQAIHRDITVWDALLGT